MLINDRVTKAKDDRQMNKRMEYYRTSEVMSRRIRSKLLRARWFSSWCLVIVLFVAYTVILPRIASAFGVISILSTALPLVFVAVGETIVILTGGIDLSVGGALSLGAALAGTQMHTGYDAIIWSVIIVAVCGTFGAINGILVSRLSIEPFVVTLATWSIMGGVALEVLPTSGGIIPTSFSNITVGAVLGIPNDAIVIMGLLLLWLYIKRTRFLRNIYTIGNGAQSASVFGVTVGNTLTTAYLVSGIFSGLGAIAYVMLTTSGDPTAGNNFILPAIAAVVIGGTFLQGGEGGVPGTVAGALVLTLLSDVIASLTLPSFWAYIGDGILLVAAVWLNTVTWHSGSRGWHNRSMSVPTVKQLLRGSRPRSGVN